MNLVTTIVAALVGAALFEALRVPAGALIGAMVAVAILNFLPAGSTDLPRPLQFLSLAAIGWLIGQGIDADTMRTLASRAGVIGIAVALLLLFGGAVAFVLARMDLLDPATAFLATSPGGLSQMSALSAAVGADAALVATLHIVRVVAVILLSPIVVKLLPSGG